MSIKLIRFVVDERHSKSSLDYVTRPLYSPSLAAFGLLVANNRVSTSLRPGRRSARRAAQLTDGSELAVARAERRLERGHTGRLGAAARLGARERVLGGRLGRLADCWPPVLAFVVALALVLVWVLNLVRVCVRVYICARSGDLRAGRLLGGPSFRLICMIRELAIDSSIGLSAGRSLLTVGPGGPRGPCDGRRQSRRRCARAARWRGEKWAC